MNFQKEKKHTHTKKIGLCELKTKTCQTFPAPRSPAPSKKYWQKKTKRRGARKLLKKNINENQTLSASFSVAGGDAGLPALLSGLTLQPGQELVQPRYRLSRGQARTQSWARLALPAPLPWPQGLGVVSGP